MNEHRSTSRCICMKLKTLEDKKKILHIPGREEKKIIYKGWWITKVSDFSSRALEVRRQLCLPSKSERKKDDQPEFYTQPNYPCHGDVHILLFRCQKSSKIYLPWTLSEITARGCALAKQGSKQRKITQDLWNQGSNQGERIRGLPGKRMRAGTPKIKQSGTEEARSLLEEISLKR